MVITCSPPQKAASKAGKRSMEFRGQEPMRVEKIEEPIDVIGKFQQGRIIPLRVRWQGRVYEVDRITGSWVYSEGNHKEYYFSFLANQSDVWEIRLDGRTMCWSLQRICLDG
jgi:hypothetical protein